LRQTQVSYQNLKAKVMTTDQQFAASEEAEMVVEGGVQSHFNPPSRIPSAIPARYRSTRAAPEIIRMQGFKSASIPQGKSGF
jgi:hypothetical protein